LGNAAIFYGLKQQ